MIILGNDFNKDKEREMSDILTEFDKITEGFTKNEEEIKEAAISDFLNSADESGTRRTRTERLHEEKEKKRSNNVFSGISDKLRNFAAGADSPEGNDADNTTSDRNENTQNTSGTMATKTKRTKKKKKYRLNVKKLIRNIVLLGIVFVLLIGGWVASIIYKLPDINPDNIYAMLSESSVLYDDDGNIIATVGSSETRTNIEYADLPEDLVNAFIAIEDKTFETHKGFNIIRIFGAIKDAMFNGGHIGGTSTITQQLARNIYLSSERSLERKIAEAYYTVIIEKELSKELIMEAYLNTINFGFDSYGVQTAAQSYFSKDVDELTLLECASLAALPKAPTDYALIKKYNPDDVDPEKHVIIHQGDDYTYVYNGEASAGRRWQVLMNMCDQGYITEEERDAALAEDLLTHINPNMRSLNEVSSYFSDYVIEQVISDYAALNRLEYAEAREKIYTSGLRIHTTMDSDIQMILDEEYSKNTNFPTVANLRKDSAGNVISPTGKLLLYSYSNYFDENGTFTLHPDEYTWLENGDLMLYGGKRLNFYKTTVQGNIDISIEFKNMYTIEDGIFYSIQGGAILIPQQYKTRDDDGNAIISADLFTSEEHKGYIQTDENGNLFVTSGYYTLRQKVVQPQSAMVITDYKTGEVKAMTGGRNTSGQKLYNRAVNPRQPGSSIKPIAVYGPALQQSFEIMQGGSTPVFETFDNEGNPVGNSYGKYWTAASIIDDAPLKVEGKIWPSNWYVGYRGLHTMRESIQQSVNVNAVKVLQQVGVEYSADFLKKLGVTSLATSGEVNDLNLSALALGGMTTGISPLEMCGAYSVFINEGTYVEPIVYTHVTNKNGETILENTPHTETVMDEGVAFIMTDMLRTVVTESFGSRAAIPNQPVGGKTGTTNESYDIWFVGFTPQYTASVWIGNDVNLELSRGSDAACEVWGKVMKRVCANLPTESFPAQPENVVSVQIDTKSGLLPSALSTLDDRGTIRYEYFIKGTEPTEADNVHQSITACSYTGYIATPMCSATYARFGTMRPYVVDIEVSDLAYELPHYYCPLHNPDPLSYPIDPAYMAGEGNGEGTLNPGIIDPTVTDTPPDDADLGENDGEYSGDIIDSGEGTTDEPVVIPEHVTPPVEEQEAPDWL